MPKLPSTLFLPPTRILLEATFLQSRGDIRHESVKRIRQAVLDAFRDAADKEGLTSTWLMTLSSKTPADFDKMLARRHLQLPEPDFEMVDVCLGCGKPDSEDCGCPAGTGTRRQRKAM